MLAEIYDGQRGPPLTFVRCQISIFPTLRSPRMVGERTGPVEPSVYLAFKSINPACCDNYFFHPS
jgi:hypothetical protein